MQAHQIRYEKQQTAPSTSSDSGQKMKRNYTLINYKQTLAMKIVLGKLIDHVRESQILLKIDNTTATVYVNRIKGVRFRHK